ncbi:acyl-CoA desaturase [Corallococcus sp. H22C18031201]|uniref:acyl-CoA desaturase n=1 Tax=Citreicoccus inhibens TaxID=2849499 RepID=UPI000E71E021|nr:fatty acid desaturase [Citreicoccus inhibens]MBU8897125.1 fatty acid desaturase [Citreicoccus inhibens]RJS19742.1 acyl-CoA desaturase [Corallococcus sp. H22C18031201]
MTRAKQIQNILAVLLGFLFLDVAIVVCWKRWVTPTDLAIFSVTYVLSGLGIAIGYHRLLTHRAFKTHKSIQYLFAVLGSTAAQGPVIEWVTDHRKHHSCADQEGDPHSPHFNFGAGLGDRLRGFWYAHVGWLVKTQGEAQRTLFSRDLLEDRGMRFIDSAFPALVFLSIVIPGAVGYLVTGTWQGGLGGLFWGGLIRIVLLHHVTFCINSVCHVVGTKRFETQDEARNVFWLVLPTLGDAWHHNHHAFPRSASHGLQWWEVDPSAMVIHAMRRVGLAWDVVEISAEQQQARLLPRAEVAGRTT